MKKKEEVSEARVSKKQNAISGILLFLLQVIRVLHRLFIGVLNQAGIAAKGICDDFFLFLFHMLTSV